jgi:hypothetical protein
MQSRPIESLDLIQGLHQRDQTLAFDRDWVKSETNLYKVMRGLGQFQRNREGDFIR